MDDMSLSRRSLLKTLAGISLAALTSKVPPLLAEVSQTPPFGLPLQYFINLGTHLGLGVDGQIILSWSAKDDAWVTDAVIGSDEFEGMTFRWVLVICYDPANFKESSATAFPELISGRDVHGICEKRSDHPSLTKL